MTQDQINQMADKLTDEFSYLAKKVYNLKFDDNSAALLATPFVKALLNLAVDLYMLLLRWGVTPEQIREELLKHKQATERKNKTTTSRSTLP